MPSRNAVYFWTVTIPAWIGAFVVCAAFRLLAPLYLDFGADLPAETMLMMVATRAYVPFLFAAVCTGLIGFVTAKHPSRAPSVSLAVLFLTAVLLAFSLFALVAPTVACGNYWPEWPAQSGTAMELNSSGTLVDSKAASC